MANSSGRAVPGLLDWVLQLENVCYHGTERPFRVAEPSYDLQYYRIWRIQVTVVFHIKAKSLHFNSIFYALKVK